MKFAATRVQIAASERHDILHASSGQPDTVCRPTGFIACQYAAKHPLFCKHDPAQRKYSRDSLPLENICYSTKYMLIAGYIYQGYNLYFSICSVNYSITNLSRILTLARPP